MAERQLYKYAKRAETTGDVKDAIRFIRTKQKDATIRIHIRGAWSGCPKEITLRPHGNINRFQKRLVALLSAPPFQEVTVVPVKIVPDASNKR
ncbi:hypothetical protein JNK62_02115 [bacterium]|nr:hypothetical protein [bacterium]